MSEPDEIVRHLASLGHPRKAVARPAAEALAAAVRGDAALRGRVAALLGSTDARRRWGAAYALALAEPAPLDAVPALLDALAADDGDVRWAAARIVTRVMGLDAGVTAAVRRLAASGDAAQRKMALYCLRDAGVPEPSLAPLLSRALEDADATVRLAALAATIALRPATVETATAILRLLDDADAGVRRAAAATLGRLGVADPSVTDALGRAASAEDAALARAATDALSRLGARGPNRR